MLQQQLKCQDLLPYIKPAQKLDLQPDYCVKEELSTVSIENASKMPVYGCYGAGPVICEWRVYWSRKQEPKNVII